MDKGSFVDVVVAREKFEREVRLWRERAREHATRGIILVEADFPKVFAIFALPSIRPSHLLFGVELDFTNYDLWPPSVRFVDPLTREPWPNGMRSPINVGIGPVLIPLFVRFKTNSDDPTQLVPECPVICQTEQGPAFLCMRGVREYHAHPAHSGDSWLQYRGTGVGTLFYILDKLHEFGIAHVAGLRVGLTYMSGGPPVLAATQAVQPGGGE